LPAETADFTQRHSFNADGGERVLHRFCFERFDNRLNFFHRAQSRTRVAKRKQMGFSGCRALYLRRRRRNNLKKCGTGRA